MLLRKKKKEYIDFPDSSKSNQNPDEVIGLDQIEASVPVLHAEIVEDVDSFVEKHISFEYLDGEMDDDESNKESPEEIRNWIRIKTLANSRYHLFKAGLSIQKPIFEVTCSKIDKNDESIVFQSKTRFEFMSANKYFFISEVSYSHKIAEAISDKELNSNTDCQEKFGAFIVFSLEVYYNSERFILRGSDEFERIDIRPNNLLPAKFFLADFASDIFQDGISMEDGIEAHIKPKTEHCLPFDEADKSSYEFAGWAFYSDLNIIEIQNE